LAIFEKKFVTKILPVYMIKIEVAFLEGRLLSSQSEQSEKFSKSPDWLCFDHINRL